MFKILLTFIFTLSVGAQVWVAENQWDENWEMEWSQWIESEKIQRTIFSSKDSPYYNIKTDCTDALIALRAIFSYENRLPFSIRLNKEGTRVHESSTRFNTSDRPLKAFIEYIGARIGTDGFARYNTYPIAFNDLRPGDFYLSRWKRNGTYIFHGEFVKEIHSTGHLTTLYSTSPVNRRRLGQREGFPAHRADMAPFGFRRFLREDQSFRDVANHEQYEILKNEPQNYFSILKETHKTEEDNLSKNLRRRVGNLCRSLQDRNYEIEQTQIYLEKINFRCMDAREFDAYSTPSRDGTLYKGLNVLMNGWKKIRKNSETIEPELILALDYLIRKNKSEAAKEAHKSLCKTKVKIENQFFNYTLKNFFDARYSKRMSSHPNDSIKSRWGLSRKKTSCKSFY